MCINIAWAVVYYPICGHGDASLIDNSGSRTLFLCPKTAVFQSYKCHKQLLFLNKRSLFVTLSNSLYLKEGDINLR